MMIKDRLRLVSEQCCVCQKYRPVDALVIRHVQTGNIICVICITEIAEVND